MQDNTVIDSVVKHGLCTGCATCVAVCPRQCLHMTETPGGLLEVTIGTQQCHQCGTCLKVCGGFSLHPDAFHSDIDPFQGKCIKAYLVQAADQELLANGQSGGAVTAMVGEFLRQQKVTGVLSTFMPKDGSLRPYSKIVRDPAELAASQGSKYMPAPWGHGLSDVRQENERICVIGLPCQFHSLFNAQKTVRKSWSETIVLKIGLVCERILSFSFLDYIFKEYAINVNQCQDFFFKRKREYGWPGQGCVRFKDGTKQFIPNRARLQNKDAFTPFFCRLCFDKMNFTSDIVCADPWGINHHPAGHSLVIAHTEKGLDAIQEAIQSGVLMVVDEIHRKRVFTCHAVEDRRKYWTVFTELVKNNLEFVPVFPLDTRWKSRQSSHFSKPLLKLHKDRGRFLQQVESREDVLNSVKEYNLDQSELINQRKRKLLLHPLFLLEAIAAKIKRTMFQR